MSTEKINRYKELVESQERLSVNKGTRAAFDMMSSLAWTDSQIVVMARLLSKLNIDWYGSYYRARKE